MREKKPRDGTTVVLASDQVHIEAADRFLVAKVANAQAEKEYKAAVKALSDFLGDSNCKALSDGRLVMKHVQPVAAEQFPRGATTRTSFSVSPKPTAA